MTKIIPGDIRAAGYCVLGAKAKCETLGLDFRAVMRDGLEISEARKFNDAQIDRMIRVACRRISREKRKK